MMVLCINMGHITLYILDITAKMQYSILASTSTNTYGEVSQPHDCIQIALR